MKKILFNCSTNIQGGPVQNAANFIIESSKDTEFNYLYLVSKNVLKILNDIEFYSTQVVLIKDSPSKKIASRRIIKQYEDKFCPDLIFTMAGPSYIKFKNKHIMGCSNPYIIYASNKDIKYGRSYLEFINRLLRTLYQQFYIMKADYYLFQTNISMNAFSNKFSVERKKLYCIPNALGMIDNVDNVHNNNKYIKKNKCLSIFCPFENYSHKGIHIIPQVSKKLELLNINAKFNLTISQNDLTNRQKNIFKNFNNINFIGRKSYSKMSFEYNKNDIVFLPSILEVFSTVCIESLYFKKPIVISNKNFNRDILESYAVYCDSFSVQDCVNKIIKASKLANNEEYLLNAKNFIKEKFSNYENRYQKFKKVFNEILI